MPHQSADQLGVAASAASILGVPSNSSRPVRKSDPSSREIYLICGSPFPLTWVVWIRFGPRVFSACDLSFETTILLGVLGGRFTGMVVGAMPALSGLTARRMGDPPLILLCGFTVGQLRNLAPDREDIWAFSPFIDLSIYRWIRRNLPRLACSIGRSMFFATSSRSLHADGIVPFSSISYLCLEIPSGGWKRLIYATSLR